MFAWKPVYLHVGLPKTGTTALQHNVFPRLPATRYVGKPTGDPIIRAVTELGDDAWRSELAATFCRVARTFGGEEERVLVSEEELSVGSLHGLADRDTIARRLHLLFPRARVLVVVRNQLTLLGSLYGYAMALPGTPHVPFNEWLARLRTNPSSGKGLHLFDYEKLVDVYAGLFGSEAVEVLLYEDLVADHRAFAGRVAQILGVGELDTAQLPNDRVNTRPTLRTVRALKLAERHPWTGHAVAALPAGVRAKLSQTIGRGPDLDTRFRPEDEAFVRDYYGEGNRVLADRRDVALARWDYPLP